MATRQGVSLIAAIERTATGFVGIVAQVTSSLRRHEAPETPVSIPSHKATLLSMANGASLELSDAQQARMREIDEQAYADARAQARAASRQRKRAL